MVNLHGHEAGNGGERPREAYSLLSLLYWDSQGSLQPIGTPLLGETVRQQAIDTPGLQKSGDLGLETL